MKLYGYFRSSAAYRVRIGLNLKGLSCTHIPVHLLRDGGEQHAPAYRALNPAGLAPTLIDESGQALTQSLAILDYLEERWPTPPLLPAYPPGRGRVRALALSIACDVHPLNNLRVLQYLTGVLKISEEQKTAWIQHWIGLGLTAFEQQLGKDRPPGDFCHGDAPGLADCCLIPQLYNARRFACPLDAYPRIRAVEAACLALPAFQDAAPERQADAV